MIRRVSCRRSALRHAIMAPVKMRGQRILLLLCATAEREYNETNGGGGAGMAGLPTVRYLLLNWVAESSSRNSSRSRGKSTEMIPTDPAPDLRPASILHARQDPTFPIRKRALHGFPGEEPVGRISAHENNQTVSKDERILRFFECINDQTVANRCRCSLELAKGRGSRPSGPLEFLHE